MEAQSRLLWQRTAAVLAAAHSLLLAVEKGEAQREEHSRFAGEMEEVQEEEHNHAAAVDALEEAQQAVRSPLAALCQAAAQKEAHIARTPDADAAAAAVDTAAAPDSDIPPGNPTALLLLVLQPTRLAAHCSGSSSHPACHQDSAPASAADRPSAHSGRQNTWPLFGLFSRDALAQPTEVCLARSKKVSSRLDALYKQADEKKKKS